MHFLDLKYFIHQNRAQLLISIGAVLALLAILLFMKGRYDSALASGKASFNQNDYAAAQKKFEAAVGMMPFSGELRGYLGLSLKRQGLDDQALSELTSAIALGYRTKIIYQSRGAIYFLRNDLSRAEADFRLAVGLATDDAVANYWLAKTLIVEGKYEEALPFAQVAVKSKNTSIKDALTELYNNFGHDEFSKQL